MLFGSCLHTLDEKNRLVIPSRMRGEIGTHLYIMKGFDGALSIYPESSFIKLSEELNSLSFNKKDSRSFIRAQLATVVELDLDKMGRVVIPGSLLNKYNISKEVVVLGAVNHIEVWDAKAYKEYEEEAESNFENIAENLNKEV